MSHDAEQSGERDWEQRYVEDETPWDTGEPDAYLAEVVEAYDIEAGRALEVGCGTGTNAIWLARRGFEVTGVDISETAIERAEAKADEAGVESTFVAADFLDETIPNAPFDVVYDRGCFHTFGTAEERSRFAARAAELLDTDGLWHSFIGSADGPPRDSGPPRRSADDVVSAVEPHFEILELRSITFEGQDEPIRAWILVARKRPAR